MYRVMILLLPRRFCPLLQGTQSCTCKCNNCRLFSDHLAFVPLAPCILGRLLQRELKLRAKKPVVLHHAGMGFTTEVSMGVADIY
eukprot:SAG22_NODE_10820_length_514_cov_1.228916_1_plen_84_part_01